MLRFWHRSPFLAGSALCHLGAAAAAAYRPELWPWAVGGLVANHGLITAAGLLPRCTWLGPNWVRLPKHCQQAVAITIDDGPDPEVTPQVLALLAQYNARATFFCIGHKVEAHPALARSIVAAGHSIENHGQRHHPLNSLRGTAGWQKEILDAQVSIERATGYRPRFYRPTAGLRNPFLDPVLQRHGLHLASWTRRAYDTRNSDPDDVLRRLMHSLGSGDILLLHDGNAAQSRHNKPVIIEVLPPLLDSIRSLGLHTVTLASSLP